MTVTDSGLGPVPATGAGLAPVDGVPWVAPALVPARRTREDSVKAELAVLRYELELARGQIAALEAAARRPISAITQTYQYLGRRHD